MGKWRMNTSDCEMIYREEEETIPMKNLLLCIDYIMHVIMHKPPFFMERDLSISPPYKTQILTKL
jgi:hypothetical protein